MTAEAPTLTAPGTDSTWRARYPGLARFLKRRSAVLALCIILLLAFFAIFGPMLWKYEYNQTVAPELIGRPQPPSWQHPAGTDFQGRDYFSRLLTGARISLSVGVISMIINLVIGVGIGVTAGWMGGRVDTLLMRFVDTLYSVPLLLVVILLQIFVKPLLEQWIGYSENVPLLISPDLLSIYLALGITNWLMMARLARGEVLAQCKRDYVMAARSLGVPPLRIVLRHVLPNCIGPLAVAATLAIPEAIFIESFLAFIGLGVSAPAASWGSLADEARNSLKDSFYLLAWPAAGISITMLAFNLFGDGLQDALDPSQRK